jgi:fructuronate reductase
MHLSALTLASLPADIHTPAFMTAPPRPRRGALGPGRFHRAHQAMVFDQLLSGGDTRWGIHGVGMTRPDLVNQLACTRRPVRRAHCRRAGREVASARCPVAHERGHHRARCRGASHRRTQHPLGHDSPSPKKATPPPWPAAAGRLAPAPASGLPGITIASCDNLQGNGHKLQALVKAATTEQDAELLRWLDAHCAFPCSMVDRIVPAATPEVLAAARGAGPAATTAPSAPKAFGNG